MIISRSQSRIGRKHLQRERLPSMPPINGPKNFSVQTCVLFALLHLSVSLPVGAQNLQEVIQDLVAANRILASQGILDGYGHVSVRHPTEPERFLLSRSLAPELVTAADIMEFQLDGRPVVGNPRRLYLERFIHGGIYAARADVNAVVHNHSPTVIAFGISKVPLRPVHNLTAFILQGVPVFDYRDLGLSNGALVDTVERGDYLARILGPKPAVLMMNHGVVVVGAALPQTVGRSIYLEQNAVLQSQALSYGTEVTYLELEGGARKQFVNFDYARAWQLWKRGVSQTGGE